MPFGLELGAGLVEGPQLPAEETELGRRGARGPGRQRERPSTL